jgi:LacI family transcriptional regulator
MGAADLHARHVAVACERLRLRVPEDVAVVGVDDDASLCTLSKPELSSIQIAYDRVGYEACRLLQGLMAGKPRPKQPLLLEGGRVIVRQSSDAGGVGDAVVSQAVKFIRQHAQRPMDVRDVLREVAVCRANLDRRFKRLLGHTASTHIWIEGIERAKTLISETEMKMATVASASGFRNYAIFFAMFRRHTGLSPAAYRKQLKV